MLKASACYKHWLSFCRYSNVDHWLKWASLIIGNLVVSLLNILTFNQLFT